MSSALPNNDEATIKKNLQQQAANNPRLAKVPEQFKSFFQAFETKEQRGGKMNLSGGRIRPEEERALQNAGVTNIDDLPLDIANKLKPSIVKSREELLEEIENGPSLQADDLKEMQYRDAPPELQKAFQDLLSQQEKIEKLKPIIIDSSRAAQPVPPAGVKSATVADLLPKSAPPPVAPSPVQQTQPAAAPLPIPAGLSATTSAPETPAAPVVNPPPAVCQRCAWPQSEPYPVKPTKADIETRIVSLGSVLQGGDGRFRKRYTLFGGTVTLDFRELTTEGHLIYQAENDIVMSDNSGKTQLAHLYSMDRIQFRRHCCGLERITKPGVTLEIPPLAMIVEQNGGDVKKALELLESYVREKCYGNESIMLAAGRSWMEFENLVVALWSDQSFYNGNP